MNHLVFLDAEAGELEKILSGTKSMLVKESTPAACPAVMPGDSLFFLRNRAECTLPVKATVVRVFSERNRPDDDLTHALKELQPRLQLTEDQYNYWSSKKQVLLVEFDDAHKISLIRVAREKVADRSAWIAFENFGQITCS